MSIKERLKSLGKLLLGGYEINRMYHSPPLHEHFVCPDGAHFATIETTRQVAGCEYPEISRHAWYTSKPGHSYGAWENGRLVCFCTYWTNTEDNLPRRFRNIRDDEIVMVDLITAESARGKGLSVQMMAFSASELKKLGYRRCLTWIWHSNHPSIRAFEKAGWIYDYFLIELPWRGEKDRIRIRLPRWVARLFG